jgi:uncharacterized lipoprotein
MKFWKPLLFTTLLASLSGCHLSPENVPLTPDVSSSSSQVGHGAPIAVVVFNAVPSEQIGTRASKYTPDQAITVSQDLQHQVQAITYNTLKKHGFSPVESGASRHLLIRITQLEYTFTDPDSLGAKIHIKCSISVKANAEDQTLQRTYHTKMDFKVLTTPSKSDDNKNINQVVSATISQMVNDQQLIQLLSQ